MSVDNAVPIELHNLGHQAYLPVWQAMRTLTDTRDAQTLDQFWLVEHDPVFTQGQAGKPEHLLLPGDIPVVHVDRGGQITYHGPGQVVLYPLLDVRRGKIGVRDLVTALENAVIDVLSHYGVSARARPDAPGVYVMTEAGEAKIASLGLRIRRGASFHGVALNVDGDLTPFLRINPCGYAGMPMTKLADLVALPSDHRVGEQLAEALAVRLKRGLVTGQEWPL
ncbi:lipoyl(octanoyl) transferase LipB [Halomonas sp. ISL-60]|uniref:lipoyl(octanoyl) transferase LipB n=1 Tax=unclassified Halomonas TaxID=2609666 RepID=UPI0007D9858C|nr:lipoyl(octanoyl) transferase LipB [Halomonas sp. ALS9]MBT2772505.1 lipoyl(octanoyl) transferase LipB [Halomonas sp. ISL-60]MBT2788592.1 lipoyl(octanoyl) transferase LipB [Halomonas sp. ISL-106]MBT2798183.1 lipoyl(octanoyl) transferase LipB [Halomonas sp. ISL-104]MBT2802707.1 lipoyl(octanoyl) transferase LipB [Halomonas sp. ISL-56]OAL60734.1 octanoyltransferase [Halomonas sp. ALS9]